MPNIASLLKEEITRVARKAVRGETEGLKKAVAQYRSQIAALKRQTRELEQQIKRMGRSAGRAGPSSAADEGAGEKQVRFSAKRFGDTRRKLGLSAHDCGLLIGASGQSVYKWEQGKARPRRQHLLAIASLRSLGKREAAARLKALAK